jgi:hypothetical protein
MTMAEYAERLTGSLFGIYLDIKEDYWSVVIPLSVPRMA